MTEMIRVLDLLVNLSSRLQKNISIRSMNVRTRI